MYEGSWTQSGCDCLFSEETIPDMDGGAVELVWTFWGNPFPDFTIVGDYTIFAVLRNVDDPPVVQCSNGATRPQWYVEFTIQEFAIHVVDDCNDNGIGDDQDISAGTSTDLDSNGVPDECQILYVDTNATGLGHGLDWDNAANDLQSMLAIARAGQEIWVAQGGYYPTESTDRNVSFELPNGVKVYGGFVGSETDRNQRDPRNNITTLSGDIGVLDDDSDNSYHVVYTDSSVTASTVLDGFRITGGNADGSDINGKGGGWLNIAGNPAVTWCRFEDNRADYGGGIYDLAGGIFVRNCRIKSNEAGVSGGGLYAEGEGAGVIFKNGLFLKNQSSSNGGAVFAYDADLQLLNCTIMENKIVPYDDDLTGGVFVSGTTGGTTLIDSCILCGNNGMPKGERSPFGGLIEAGQCKVDSGNLLVQYSLSPNILAGTCNITGQPLFTAGGGEDYVLRSDSPGINAGNPAHIPVNDLDLRGQDRVLEGRIDCGAFEGRADSLRACEPATVDIDCDDGDPDTNHVCLTINGFSGTWCVLEECIDDSECYTEYGYTCQLVMDGSKDWDFKKSCVKSECFEHQNCDDGDPGTQDFCRYNYDSNNPQWVCEHLYGHENCCDNGGVSGWNGDYLSCSPSRKDHSPCEGSCPGGIWCGDNCCTACQACCYDELGQMICCPVNTCGVVPEPESVIDTKGTEFFLTFLSTVDTEIMEDDGHLVFYSRIPSIVITSQSDTQHTDVTVDYPARCPKFSKIFTLSPGETRRITLPGSAAAGFDEEIGYGWVFGSDLGTANPVYSVYDNPDPADENQLRNELDNAVHIRSSKEVTCHMENRLMESYSEHGYPHTTGASQLGLENYLPYKPANSSSASIALPVEAWEKKYYCAGAFFDDDFVEGPITDSCEYGQLIIVAAYDNTTITIIPSKPLIGAGDVPETVYLNSGESYATATFAVSNGSDSDLTGTKITSTKPVGVTFGYSRVHIPHDRKYADHVFQVAMPTAYWGREFPVQALPGYNCGNPYKVVASENQTAVYVDGVQYECYEHGTAGTDHLLDAGGYCDIEINEPYPPDDPDSEETWMVWYRGGHVISADKPVSVMQYMPSSERKPRAFIGLWGGCWDWKIYGGCREDKTNDHIGYECEPDVNCRISWCGSDDGDPAMNYLIPVERWDSGYSFTTARVAIPANEKEPVLSGPPYFPKTNHIVMVFVRAGDEQLIKLVRIDKSEVTGELEEFEEELEYDPLPQAEICSNGPGGPPHFYEDFNGNGVCDVEAGIGYRVAWKVIEPGQYRTYTTDGLSHPHGVMLAGYDYHESYLFNAGATFGWLPEDVDNEDPKCGACIKPTDGDPEILLDCRVSDINEEDVNTNGIADVDEDLDGDGVLDKNTGLYSVMLTLESENLELIGPDCFKVGAETADFQVAVGDLAYSASGVVIVTDKAGRTCEIPINYTPMEPVIDFLNADCDAGGENCRADECAVIAITSENSITGDMYVKSEWDFSGGDSFQSADAVGIEVEYVWTNVGTPGLCSAEDQSVHTVWLRMTDENGSSAETSKQIAIADLCPQWAEVFGPTRIVEDSTVCFNAAATTPCDDLASICWDSGSGIEPDPGFENPCSTLADGLEKCITFTETGMNWVAFQVADADGDTFEDDVYPLLSAWLPVEVIPNSNGFSERSNDLQLETRLHTYQPGADVDGYITHKALVRLRNTGTSEVRWPIYLAFESLNPDDGVNPTELVGDLLGEGEPVLGIVYPHVEVPNPDEAYSLAVGESTEFFEVSWNVQAPAGEGGCFDFEMVAYALQRPPQIVKLPDEHAVEGKYYRSEVAAIDYEGDTVFYQLADLTTDPPAEYNPPDFLSINSMAGTLMGMPSQAETRGVDSVAYPVTLLARDGFIDSYAKWDFNLIVVRDNVAPEFTTEPDTVAYAGENYITTIGVFDEDEAYDGNTNGNLTLTVETYPATGISGTELNLQAITGLPGNYQAVLIIPEADLAETPELWVVLTVDDDDGEHTDTKTAVKEFPVVVTSCITPLQIRDIEDQTAQEGLPYSKGIELINDPEPDGFKYYEIEVNRDGAEGLTISDDGHIQWLPGYNAHGTYQVRVLVYTDPYDVYGCFDTEVFQLTVADRNTPPRITSEPLTEATEGEHYSWRVTAVDDDGPLATSRLRFFLQQHPAGMEINPVTGFISWYPAQNAAELSEADRTVHLAVVDEHGAFDEREFVITVTAVNLKPYFYVDPKRYAREEEEYTQSIFAIDEDGDELDYELLTGPDDLITTGEMILEQVAGRWQLRWTPVEGTADMEKFLVTVATTEKYTPEEYGDQLSYEIDVRPPYIPCNSPILDKTQNVIHGSVRVPDGMHGQEGLHESILFASDPDTAPEDLEWYLSAFEQTAGGSLVSVPIDDGPSWGDFIDIEPYSRATIRWYLNSSNINKRYFIKALVDDDCDNDFVVYSLDVYDANGPNNPPVIEDDFLTTARVDEDYQHTIRAYDPDGNNFTLTLEPGSSGGQGGGAIGELPDGLEFTTSNGELSISWLPQANQVGTWWLKVTVTDDGDPVLQSFVNFPITVSLYGENQPVTITECINDRAIADELYEEYVSISDGDTYDTHVFELVESPANADIDPSTGLITWIPTTAQLGTRYFTILVTDAAGSWYEQPCVVNVYPEGSSLDSTPPNIVKPAESRIRCSSTGGLCCTNGYLAVEFAFTDYDNPDSWVIEKHGFPIGMELVDIDTNSTDGLYEYEIRWPLVNVENGSYEIAITVTDSDEISDEVEFTLLVSNNGTNRAPTITSTPAELAAVGQEYTYTVIAEDDDDLANAEFTLYRKAATALFEEVYVGQQLQPDRGLIRWTPSYGQLGVEDFLVRVTDAEGAVAEKEFTVTVSRDGDNHAPRISSHPITRASTQDDYQYPVLATDVDPGEKFTWSVWSKTAVGLAFDTKESNLLKWAAEDMVVGTHEVTVRVTDSQFASAEQTFTITVSPEGTNDPPAINSDPVTTYTPGSAYTASVRAIDYENNPLPPSAYTVTSDADLYFDQTNAGLLLSNGNITGDDTYDVTVTVTDSGAATAARSWQLWPDTITQAAPWIITNPLRRVVAGTQYSYPLENLPVTGADYELVGFAGVDYPADLSLVGGNTISWLTAEEDAREEPYRVKVKLTDDYDRSITQQLEIYVDHNLPPEFRSLAPGWAVVNRQYVYVPEAVDPEGTAVDITITDSSSENAPEFNQSTGEFLWTPNTNGVCTFTIQAVDQQGRSTEQTFTVNAVDEDQGDYAYPNVEVDVPCRPCSPGEDVDVAITNVYDDGLLDSVLVTVTDHDGIPLAGHAGVDVKSLLTAAGSYPYPIEHNLLTAGELYLVEVTATDSVGQATTARTDFTVDTGSSDSNPVADILDPIGNEYVEASDDFQQVLISDVIDIKGYAYDSDGDFAKYELQYRPVNDDPSEPFVVFHTGYTEVEKDIDNPNTLGQFDPTMLENGLYEVRVVAYDARYNQSSASSYFYSVVGNKKIGNLSMSFVDLEVPVQGIPITIARTYDSRNKSKGDFGYGWRLAFSSLTLQETMPMGLYWFSDEYLETGCLIYGVQGHSVMITWPGGHTEVFEFRPSAVATGLSTDSCSEVPVDSWDFDNTSGGTSKLRLADSYPDYWIPYDEKLVDTAGKLWQSQAYILETADGTQYRFEKNADVYNSRTARLTTITDTNGNWIEFQKEAVIHHPSNRKISMKRDGENRIYKVIDFEGNEIHYNYDQNGDLIKVTDREENETRFVYDRKHNLADIIDPRGISVARNIYDDNGRLRAHIDAEGNRIDYTHNIQGKQEIVTDRNGYPTLYNYDDHGSVVRVENALGHVTNYSHTYNSDNEIVKTVTSKTVTVDGAAVAITTTNGFDEDGNLTESFDFNGSVTSYEYDNGNRPEFITDPLGNETINDYDDSGNLERMTRRDVNGKTLSITDYVYDPNTGQLRTITDPLDRVTSMVYNADGNLKRQESARQISEYKYDSSLRVSESIQYRTLGDGTLQELVSRTDYDENGRVIRTVNAEGVETTNTYNSIGKRETVTTPSGTTRYDFDLRGNLNKVVYPDETFTEAFFDAEGRRIKSIDRDGNETQYKYDALGRLTKTLLPGHTEEDPVAVASDYDELGRVVARYDERNLQAVDPLAIPLTRYIYDSTPDELPIEETVRDRLDQATHYEYDRNGNLLRVTDARNKTTEYEYDGNGQRTKTIFHDETFIKTEYDKAGQRKAEIDQAGVRTEFDYDDAGRLKEVLDAKGGLTEYTYDEVGNMLTQKRRRRSRNFDGIRQNRAVNETDTA